MTYPFLGLGFYTWSEKFSRNITNTGHINYTITNTGGDFVLRSNGTVNYTVNWGDGNSESSTSNALTHTYSAGNHVVRVYSDGVYRPHLNNVTADATQITSVAISSGADLGTSLDSAWRGGSNLATFTCPFNATSSVTNFNNTWNTCSSLTSFPELNTSSGTNFGSTWRAAPA